MRFGTHKVYIFCFINSSRPNNLLPILRFSVNLTCSYIDQCLRNKLEIAVRHLISLYLHRIVITNLHNIFKYIEPTKFNFWAPEIHLFRKTQTNVPLLLDSPHVRTHKCVYNKYMSLICMALPPVLLHIMLHFLKQFNMEVSVYMMSNMVQIARYKFKNFKTIQNLANINTTLQQVES